MKHQDHPEIKALLENIPPQFETKNMTAYQTKSGLVVFFEDAKGWTMLTECPSVSIDKNVSELGAMIEGIAGKR